ncbi:MAG: 16S rRNA (uracil(1498)-N(3))-methyltransferase [Gammaproteobacteria bacterium]|nr:MAG: 16S rRNA (uracil(1498)-N(3))-methyltransferase [Gammaproteobacteria bacterium]
MRLSRIYVAQPLTPGNSVELDSAANHYVQQVLRLKAGAEIVLFNADDCYDYVSLLSFRGKRAIASIKSRALSDTESSLISEIIQGLSRNDHMEWIVQKNTELGVNRIFVFNAEHTQIPLKPAQLEKRLAHWRAVAINACEQCGRHRPPDINFDKNLPEVLNQSIQRETKLLLDFDGVRLNSLLTPVSTSQQVSILVGPEGGLSKVEIQAAKAAGFVSVRLGPRVLRTETAALSALAIVQSLWGDV